MRRPSQLGFLLFVDLVRATRSSRKLRRPSAGRIRILVHRRAGVPRRVLELHVGCRFEGRGRAFERAGDFPRCLRFRAA